MQQASETAVAKLTYDASDCVGCEDDVTFVTALAIPMAVVVMEETPATRGFPICESQMAACFAAGSTEMKNDKSLQDLVEANLRCSSTSNVTMRWSSDFERLVISTNEKPLLAAVAAARDAAILNPVAVNHSAIDATAVEGALTASSAATVACSVT